MKNLNLNIREYCDDDKKIRKIKYDNTKHYPNKNEAHKLRQIMASTGLNEEEVRFIKKYRIILSDAQKCGQIGCSKIQRHYKNLIKQACKKTKLAKEHPETIKILSELIKKSHMNHTLTSFMYRNMSAKNVVKYY